MTRILATCERCGAEHDPHDTGQWECCPSCYAEALLEHSAARKVAAAT